MPSNTQVGGQPQLWAQDFSFYNTSLTTVAVSGATILVPDVTIQANFMNPGNKLRCVIYGKGSTASSAAGTVQWACLWGGVGGTSLAATSALTLIANITNACWTWETIITCTAVGSLFAQGWIRAKSLFSTPAHAPIPSTAPAKVTGLTFSANENISFAINFSANSNSFTSNVYTLESWGS